MKDFKTLSMWSRSHELTLKIYEVTKNMFPREEIFGLSSQVRRSSSSIPTNIAEGCGRNSDAELKRFLVISTGSCSELEYQLLLAKDLKYIDEPLFIIMNAEVTEIRKMLFPISKSFSTNHWQLAGTDH
ncbi:four helix bundle protein [Hufsiella ginkgonis]|uniref:Four helix bundle protein n=1 Tax=Hufsiella ginkgonis TaxID=2695274 RepID=A0A7K1XVQ0_9SPHI|nr:four helix bundle protein [Hufsiella ginkgonis]MXV14849.1 four helix bundle protein [Hufsiella ginkgonis]